MSLKVYNTKGELQTDTQLEDLIEEVRDTLLKQKEIQEKSLFVLGALEKHSKDFTTLELDPEEVEEAINDLVVNIE